MQRGRTQSECAQFDHKKKELTSPYQVETGDIFDENDTEKESIRDVSDTNLEHDSVDYCSCYKEQSVCSNQSLDERTPSSVFVLNTLEGEEFGVRTSGVESGEFIRQVGGDSSSGTIECCVGPVDARKFMCGFLLSYGDVRSDFTFYRKRNAVRANLSTPETRRIRFKSTPKVL